LVSVKEMMFAVARTKEEREGIPVEFQRTLRRGIIIQKEAKGENAHCAGTALAVGGEEKERGIRKQTREIHSLPREL